MATGRNRLLTGPVAAILLAGALWLLPAVNWAGANTPNSLVIFSGTTYEGARVILGRLSEMGFKPVHMMLPYGAIGYMDGKTHGDIISNKRELWVHRVVKDVKADLSEFAALSSQALVLAALWNDLFAPGGLNTREVILERVGKLPAVEPQADMLVAPPPSSTWMTEPEMHVGGSPPWGSAPADTSEYMIGNAAKPAETVYVKIVLPESVGAENTETWNDNFLDENSDVRKTYDRVVNGFNWWAARAPECANVRFDYSYTVVGTSYEPIRHTGAIEDPATGIKGESLWIPQMMTRLAGPSSEGYIDRVRAYAHSLRVEHDSDWAFVVFVARSINQEAAGGNGMFTDTTCGYAYIGGPFVVMTTGNGPWKFDRLDIVTAHEVGHIFYALDEYPGSPYNPDLRSGYLGIFNRNHIVVTGPGVGHLCVMRDEEGAFLVDPDGSLPGLCPYTMGMVGWVDTSGYSSCSFPACTGTNDFLITSVPPTAALAPHSPNPDSTKTPYFIGTATVGLYPSPVPRTNFNMYGLHHRINVQSISKVEYRVDGGNWTPAVPMDTQWDGGSENFDFNSTEVEFNGTYLYETRAFTAGCPVREEVAPFPQETVDIIEVIGKAPLDYCPLTKGCEVGYRERTPSDDRAADIAISASGSIYVCGTINDDKAGARKWILARYDGACRLAEDRVVLRDSTTGKGTEANSVGAAVATDANGNVFTAGKQGTDHEVAEWIVMKYHQADQLTHVAEDRWSPADATTGDCIPTSISVDQDGNVIVVGRRWIGRSYNIQWVIRKYDNDLNLLHMAVWPENPGAGDSTRPTMSLPTRTGTSMLQATSRSFQPTGG